LLNSLRAFAEGDFADGFFVVCALAPAEELALLWQIIHAACLRRSIFGSAGIAAAAVER
jgi:hypothetical protein